MKSNSSRESYIDGLKGWAILGIIMVHCGLWGQGRAMIIGDSGARMCQLFFVISGYLIYGSYDRLIKSGKTGVKDSVRWLWKRILRLLPLWYVALIYHLVSGVNIPNHWIGSIGRITLGNIIAHIFMLHDLFPYYMNSIIGVEWYVGALLLFILLVPFIYKIARKIIPTAILFIVVSLVVMYGTVYVYWRFNPFPIEDESIWNNYIFKFGIWNQIPLVLIGILIYLLFGYLEDNSRIYEAVKKNSTVISIVLLALSLFVQWELMFTRNGQYPLTAWGIAFGILFIGQKIRPLYVIDNPVTRLLGKYSYAIYLFHFGIGIPLYNLIGINFGNEVVDCLIKIIFVTLVTLAVGIVLTKFIEEPCVNWVNRIMARDSKINKE